MSSKAVRHTLALVALALPFLLIGCADFSRGPGPVPEDTAVADTGGGDAAAGDSANGCTPGNYETEIYPLLQLTCDVCHSSSGAAGSTGLVFTGSASDDYAKIAALIDTANPASSVLVSKSSGKTHGGGAVFAADGAEEEALICWIGAGAPH